MRKLKVKYCYSEEETNEFLKTLNIDKSDYPKLQSIQYLPNGNDIAAIVQYFTDK